jgi:membrane-bound lytic murein transglycosylase B
MAQLSSKLLTSALILIASLSIATGAEAKKRHKKRTLSKPAISAAPTLATASGPRYAEREDVMAAGTDMARRAGLDEAWVQQVLGQARKSDQVLRLMQPAPAGTPKNWRVYRSRFIEPIRIKAGVKFWEANRRWLERAQAQTGVPAEIIVGIIGVETLFGQHTGNVPVLDALTTLAFDFPPSHPRAQQRSEFFRSELEQFLVLARRTGTDPLRLRGSYAGALGMPQFMPSSWVRFAVDFDRDGHVDLFHSNADVIGSVANYFVAFNWKPGMPTHYPVTFDTDRLDKAALLAPDILPTFTAADFKEKGAILEMPAQAHAGPLALVELQNGEDAPSYVAGTENFYAITRYNWSSYYAMAVIELGQAVALAIQAKP